MLVGDAGIGKTWIAREVARQAGTRGAVVLWGSCLEGDWQPAYGPWVEAIGEYARASAPQRLQGALGPGAPALARLMPQVRAALPDTAEAPPLGTEEERLRICDAVVQFLLAVARECPLLLVIDDLHWADRDSLRLLRYLSHFVTRSRMLVVGAYRESEITTSHPLEDLLPILRRETDYRQVNVRGLGLQEVAEYLSQAAGQPLPGALVQAIHHETGGNPFYVREVFRHLTEEGKILLRGGRWSTDLSMAEMGIPEGVRQVVHRRLSRLSGNANSMLRMAAGFTAGFEFAALQVLSELPEEALLDCIDEALRAGLLTIARTAPPVYDFAHTIVRHTLYDELNPDRRARLHRRIALALERVPVRREEDHAAEVAFQYYGSSGIPGAARGIPYALRAAEQARAAYAHERAARFLQMAHDLAAESTAAERAKIICKQAIAEAEALMLDKAERTVQDALSALSEAGTGPRARAEFLAVAARALKDGGAGPDGWRPLVEQGLEASGSGSTRAGRRRPRPAQAPQGPPGGRPVVP